MCSGDLEIAICDWNGEQFLCMYKTERLVFTPTRSHLLLLRNRRSF